MKVLSLYFSGTGGTKSFQTLVQHLCKNYNAEFTEIDITKNNVGISDKFLNKFDIYLIGTPILFYSAPTTFIQNIKSTFISGQNKRVILYTTSTSGKYSSIYGLANTLRSRGYIVSGIINVTSSNNFYYSDTLYPPKINSKQYIVEDYEIKARIVKELIFTTTSYQKLNRYRLFTQLRFYISMAFLRVAFLNSFAFRNFRASNSVCGACGICAQMCPTNNIEMHNYRPIFKNHCLACSRCIQNCPKNAITYKNNHIRQMSHLTLEDFNIDDFNVDSIKLTNLNIDDFTLSN